MKTILLSILLSISTLVYSQKLTDKIVYMVHNYAVYDVDQVQEEGPTFQIFDINKKRLKHQIYFESQTYKCIEYQELHEDIYYVRFYTFISKNTKKEYNLTIVYNTTNKTILFYIGLEDIKTFYTGKYINY